LQPGWSVDTSKEDEVVWKVSVKNIDTVDIKLYNTTCFVLMSIDGASDVRSWYIDTATSVLVESQDTVPLEFK